MLKDYGFELLDPSDIYLNTEEECDHTNVIFTERWYKSEDGKAVREHSEKRCFDCGKLFEKSYKQEFNDFPFVKFNGKYKHK